MSKTRSWSRSSVRLGHTLALACLGVACACSSLRTGQDFEHALKRAQGGESKAVIAQITRGIPEMTAEQRKRAVATLARIEGAEAQRALIRLLDSKTLGKSEKTTVILRLMERGEEGSAPAILSAVQKDHSQFSDPVERYVIRTNPPGLAPVMHQIARKSPGRLSAEMVTHFGKSHYKPAIPDIIAKLNKGHLTLVGARALGRMADAKADDYLFKTAGMAKHPARAAALVSVFESRGTTRPKAARQLLYRTLDHYKEEPRIVIASAIDGAPRLARTKAARKKLIKLYRSAKLPEHRTRALRSLATMEGADAYVVWRDLNTRLIALQSGLNLYRPDRPAQRRRHRRYRRRSYRRRSIPRARIDNPRGHRTVGPTRRHRHRYRRFKRLANDWTPTNTHYAHNAKRYRAALYRFLRSRMPAEDARMLYSRLSLALRAYADSDSASARFLRRSYRKHFRVDETQARHFMARGLRKPGSVHAVLLGIHREYLRDPLRVYAIAQIFGVARWQAAMLLDYIR